MSAFGVPIIGLIGGIGSGKTALAQELSLHFKVHHLNADAAGHRALQDERVKNDLVKEFGPQILDSQGEVIRQEIAKLVFGNSPQHQQARNFLDSVVHPVIREHLEQELVHAIEQGVELVVLDAALMLEAGWGSLCDAIVFLDTPEAVRIERVKQRGWTENDLKQREASQLPLPEKKSRSDLILNNTKPLEQVGQELADYIQRTFFKFVANPVVK